MKNDLQKYLDGELPLDALTAEERAEAEEWQIILRETSELRGPGAPRWLETRVMATLPAQPHRSRLGQLLSWLTLPQAVRVRPASIGLAGAAAALLLFFARTEKVIVEPVTLDTGAGVHTVAAGQPAIIYVQFVVANSSATSIAVAGDFNGWDTATTQLTDTDGDGVWTGLVALRPGLHKYMFVVNGEEWMTDPQAERYVDDEFGMRNAVITVTPPGGRAI